jgi:hypothetical protein
MRPGQLEVRLVMIEPPAGPALDTVALAAGLSELPVVHVIALVAADAGHGCLAPCHVRLVAAVAFERGMGALEREVRHMMIELRATELNDVGLAPLVFRVAGAAFADAGVGHAAVVAVVLAHVGRDVLVTIQAQGRLLARIGAIVAVGAVLLLLHVRARDLARHQQCFHRRRKDVRSCDNR